MTSEPDLYEILQVSPRAEADVIEAAFRRLARKYHPDVNPDVLALQRMQELNRAFEVLIDPRKRTEYDRQRLRALARKALAEQPADPVGTLYREAGSTRRQDILTRLRVLFLWIPGGVVALAGLSLIIWQVTSDSGDGPSTQTVPTSTAPLATSTVAAASAEPDPSATSPPQGSGTFSNGTWLVGEEIAPGVWRAYRSRDCSWKRLASIEGTTDIIAASGTYLTVEIAPTDAAFSSEGCGWWTQILTPPSSTPRDPFGPGTWLVNDEIAPGLWQNSDSSEGCSWTRLASLDGTPFARTGTGLGNSIITIQISETDRAFDSKGCGTWTRTGD